MYLLNEKWGEKGGMGIRMGIASISYVKFTCMALAWKTNIHDAKAEVSNKLFLKFADFHFNASVILQNCPGVTPPNSIKRGRVGKRETIGKRGDIWGKERGRKKRGGKERTRTTAPLIFLRPIGYSAYESLNIILRKREKETSSSHSCIRIKLVLSLYFT